MADESVAKPFYSVLVLAFFCSFMVAAAAVGLRPLQNENKALDQQKNILLAAGLFESDKPIDELFAGIDTRIVELATGKFVAEETMAAADYNQLKAAMSSDMGRPLSREEDIARIRRLEKYSLVYLVQENEKIQQIILPIRGKGLWSTLYGYLAVKGDLSTIIGISFYEHGETPGLGGEIENPRWQAGWQGKKVFDEADETAIQVGKATAKVEEIHQVDGISGATLTVKGVNDIMAFWFGENGFRPFFEQLKNNGGLNG